MDLKEAIRGGPSSSVTSAVVLVVLILPLLGLWTSSLFFIRREDNATPTAAFTYMKIVYPIAFLCVNPALGTSNSVYSLIRALTFQLIHLVLEIAMRRIPLPPGPNEEDFSHRMAYMSNVLDALSSTLLDITDIFLILALFELGNGFLERLTGKSPSFPLVVRYTLLLPSALILYLAVATHVRSYYIWSESLLAGEDSEQRLQEDIKELEEWDTPLLALWWAASLLLFAYACFLWNKAKGAKGNAQVLDVSFSFRQPRIIFIQFPLSLCSRTF
jgi:hypothetical protein